MQIAEEWLKTWICLSIVFAWARASRPRFDVSTDMGMVLVPADADVDTAIFRLRATDQDADFPLIFEIIATTSPIVRVENLPCTLYNKVCQANVILTRRLVAGRLHDFVVRVRDSKGDVNSMQATISVTNATTPRDRIFPHLPSLIMVPEDTKPEKELDYLLVESNPWSGKPVYIELWQPKELFKIRQRQMGSRTKGVITLTGDLDFETQSMYTLTMYATDPFTEPGKDTRNIAGVYVVVIVQDVQDVPPVFTLAPPLTKVNNTVKAGDVILRVHAEDGDKGVPREVTYGLISEGNPFTPFFNVSENTGEIILAKPLEELTQITHVGAPIVLKIVAEEIRSSRNEPPAQATIVELGLLLGEPGNSPPYFENDNYVAWMDENAEPGTIISFAEGYSTIIRDEDIGKAGVFSLILDNNNGTFEVSPAVAERVANFMVTVRDNNLIDYEKFKSLKFQIRAQEVGPATNLSASVPVTIFLRDINDNSPVFDTQVYEVTLPENPSAGTRVMQVSATDQDAGSFGKIQYTKVAGDGNEAFEINSDTGVITIAMGSVLDREQTARLELTVEARDEEGKGMRGTATLIVNILDVNDNPPIFERETYEFLLNSELTNFTVPAIVKALDADVEPPNNVVRYEIVHGNYDNKFQLDEEIGELKLREPISTRKTRQVLNLRKRKLRESSSSLETLDDPPSENSTASAANLTSTTESSFRDFHLTHNLTDLELDAQNQSRRRRAEDTPLFIITVRAYDLGVPHLSSIAQIRVMRPMSALARIVTFVMPGENPDPTRTAETLATITGSRVVIQEIKPYINQIELGTTAEIGKRSVVVARVEQGLPGTVVDVDKIREILAANGFGIISGMDNVGSDNVARSTIDTTPQPPPTTINSDNNENIEKNSVAKNASIIALTNEEVVVYKTENKLLTWLLILLGLFLLAALITLIACCICPSCPFYMEPRKRRIHSSETLVMQADGRPKRHLRRKPIKMIDGHNGARKEAWSADPERQQWQFNRRNTKNPGIASLPGDIAPNHYHQQQQIERDPRYSLSLREGGGKVSYTNNITVPPLRLGGAAVGGNGNERIYMEDMETEVANEISQMEMDSLRRHELERDSEAALRNDAATARLQQYDRSVRESHFYRDGNAEVMKLVTRGDIEERKNFNKTNNIYHVNGKDILLQRFIEDQNLRSRNPEAREGNYLNDYHHHDGGEPLDSQRRINNINGPAEIIIIPERLEVQQQPSYGLKQHQEQQMDVGDESVNYQQQRKEGAMPRVTMMRDTELLLMAGGDTSRSGDKNQAHNATSGYPMIHDAELVRQNALLTRLLLEKEAGSHLSVPIVDSSSFLETQSLPGHVAIATQTDRTTSTQTEFLGRSRSDNEESGEDPRARRKTKVKSRHEKIMTTTMEDVKKMRTIWVKTPIPEEKPGTRTKIEVMEKSRTVSISPDAGKRRFSTESEDLEEDDDNSRKRTSQVDQISNKALQKGQKKSKKTSEDICVIGNDDSTTTSPETKESSKKKMTTTTTTVAAKVGKMIIRKPPRAAKKSTDKNTSNGEGQQQQEPSFRVLEREISNIQQKIRQFGEKKFRGGNGDGNSKYNNKEQQSEDDSGATYDVSRRKKFEVTKSSSSVKKSTESRETSPAKVFITTNTTKMVEGEEEDEANEKTRRRIVKSSDFEDYAGPPPQQCEFSGRNRSELKRQTHVEIYDTMTRSSSEKNSGKSDESAGGKLGNKFNWSSSSPSKDSGKLKKSTEKKSLPSQKNIKRPPTINANGTRHPSPNKSSRAEEERRLSRRDQHLIDRARSSAAATKSISRSRNQECKAKHLLTTTPEVSRAASLSRELPSIDLDKLARDVRGVVEKEISSLREALLDKSLDNNKDVESPTKVRRTAIMSKSMEINKRDSTRLGKSRTKSTQGSSSPGEVKSDDAISFIVIENNRTALSAADHSKKYDKVTTRRLEKSRVMSSSSYERRKPDDSRDVVVRETFDKSFNSSNAISSFGRKSDDDRREIETSVSREMDKFDSVSDDGIVVAATTADDIHKTSEKFSANDIKDIETSASREMKKFDSVSDDRAVVAATTTDDIHKASEKSSTSDRREIETSASREIKKFDSVSDDRTVVAATTDDIHKTSKKSSTSDRREIETSASREMKKFDSVSDDGIVVAATTADDIYKTNEKYSVNDTREDRENLIEKIDDTAKVKHLADGLNETKKFLAGEVEELKKIALDGINEKNKSLDKKMEGIKKMTSDGIDKTKTLVEVEETKKSISDGIDETKSLIDVIEKTENILSVRIDETKKSLVDEMEDTKNVASEMIDETKRSLVDKIEETKNIVSEEVDEMKNNLAYEIEETKGSVDNKLVEENKESIDETKSTLRSEVVSKVAAYPIEKNKEITAGKIEKSKKVEILSKTDKTDETSKAKFVEITEKVPKDSLDETKKPEAQHSMEKDDVDVSPSKEGEIVFTYTVDSANDLVKSANEGTDKESSRGSQPCNLKSDALKFMSKCLPRKIRVSMQQSSEESNKATTSYYREETRESIRIVRSSALLGDTTRRVNESDSKSNDGTKEETASSGTNTTLGSEVGTTRSDSSNKTIFLCEQPKKPIFETTNAIGDETNENDDGSEDDSSAASDASNRTALRTLPYGTPPRYSMSSGGGGASGDETAEAASDGGEKTDVRTRQKWSDGSKFLKTESPAFPKKIEVVPISVDGTEESDQPRGKKSSTVSKSTIQTEDKKFAEVTESRSKIRPIVVAVKRKEQHQNTEISRKVSPRREKVEERSTKSSTTSTSRLLKVSPSKESRKSSPMRADDLGKEEVGAFSPRVIDYGRDPEIANARSRYMAWYQQKRSEMERKRRERKAAEEELLRRGGAAGRKLAGRGRTKDGASAEDDARATSKENTEVSRGHPHMSRLRIRPLVNVESEQLKAIVRQGRKLRKAEGTDHRPEDPPVQIFAPDKPPRLQPIICSSSGLHQIEPRHHLTQHSEYKYEKAMPVPMMPFYLHPPPPPPHPSPEHFQNDDLTESRRLDDDLDDSGIAVSMQSGVTRLRHQQLLEKKSVFDIAYSEAAPTQLRSDSSTPPS